MCEYKSRNGEICLEKALPNSKYCILHIVLPEDTESAELKKINELKEEKVQEKVDKGDFNFEGAKLLEINFSKVAIKGNVNFKDVVIIRDALFSGAKIGGYARFDGAKVGRSARFDGAEIGGDAWFYGAEIGESAWFVGAKIGGSAPFGGAEIGGDASFDEAKIGGYALFDGAKIGGYARFDGAKIGRSASFDGAEIGESAWFHGAEIGGDARFYGAEIGESASFDGAEIGGSALFDGAEIGESASFDGAKIGRSASFDGAKIGGSASFDLLEIKGKLCFRDAIFEEPEAQEESCRKAKRICEDLGDRIEADYYFYREMEAKRKQKYKTFSLKPILKLIRKLRLEKLISNHIEFFEKERRIYRGFLELPIQYIFGYGVYPWRVIATWFITVFSLAFVYWYGNGIIIEENLLWWERIIPSIYFSIVTAATPGYGGYKPASGFYQGLASFEAIFGTFMWAAFIATFARKYMR